MSAFQVSQKTINQVVSYLQNCDSEKVYDRWMKEACGISTANEVELSKRMAVLNAVAVEQRYGKEPAFVDHTFRYELATEIQVFKSLRCWLYQCTEGTVPNSPLYKVMSKIADSIAYHIISKLPAYDKAEWDATESTHEVEIISLYQLSKKEQS